LVVTEKELDLDTLVFKLTGDVPRLLGDPGPVRMGGHPGDPNASAAPPSLVRRSLITTISCTLASPDLRQSDDFTPSGRIFPHIPNEAMYPLLIVP